MTRRDIIEDSLLALTILCLFSFIFSFTYAFQSDLQQNTYQTIEPTAITSVPRVALEQSPIFVNFAMLSVTQRVTTSTPPASVADTTVASEEPPVVINEEIPSVIIPVKPKVAAKVIESSVVVTSPPAQTSVQEEEFAVKLVSLIEEQTNEFRTRNNLKSLKSNSALESIAETYSTTMLEGDFFSHTDQDGCDLMCRFKANGYEFFSVGENLAQMKFSVTPTALEAASQFMEGWQESAGHRENLLSPLFTHQGIGVAMSNGALYVTVDFSKQKP